MGDTCPGTFGFDGHSKTGRLTEVWLRWDLGIGLAALAAVVWIAVRHRRDRWGRVLTPLSKEFALLLVVYSGWRRLGQVTVGDAAGAFRRSRLIWRTERALHLPNEVTLQRWVLHAHWLVRFADMYYVVFHVAPLGVFLVWLYIYHRDAFGHWRNQLAFVSLVSAVIQFVPVAPPRFFPQFGFVDTAAIYGPQVYDKGGQAVLGQLAAMPSTHVAWAMLIGVATVRSGTSRWRWIGAVHAVMTVLAVTVTAYHWLLDGIVATGIMLIGLAFAATWPRKNGRSPILHVPHPPDVTPTVPTRLAGPDLATS